MLININTLNGFSKDLAQIIANKSNKPTTTLDEQASSVFTQVEAGVQGLVEKGNLNFAKVYQALYQVVSKFKDFFKGVINGVAKFCKKVTDCVLKHNEKDRNRVGGREELVQAAMGYEGVVNDSKTGNLLFSDGKDVQWCANTVSTIVKDVCGGRLPEDFGSSSVADLRAWAIKEEAYADTSTMKLEERQQYILNNIKPGDIMIEKRGGKSHTGIVIGVEEKDGKVYFRVLEGNAGSRNFDSRQVKIKEYPYNSGTLSGFIKMDKWLDESPT